MPELVIDPVPSAGELQRSLSPGAADEHGDVDGDRLTVTDAEKAERLVDTYPNVRWADSDVKTDTYPDEPSIGRAELDSDGVTYDDGDTPDGDIAGWDEDEWLDGTYQDRADLVRTGAVDPHLDDIEAAETSQTVIDAVATRRDELGD